ncbi:hypothetical protein Pmar_PMAR018403 [Perkinsus marinus ATCC 50983]|uniref:Uncharacterized protein n=1 Tax=Perkinsus marinus (strain ATCC 50983 / TXsc) TaxID=423536 RepID=C5LJE7_PERM5|nr:hypothetical protein Pmar_PMAR018403 [Perkinsus marinus ATCC 50983]EER03147.1 hypothetical protein Pmar_PMAR018403 [Perkinsus marinus ATCC 50983]|eukprot:XP_002771331.1 hypothetical protein Pmar_PMAR018403 [Perkinsus marinus ATCC 50983]
MAILEQLPSLEEIGPSQSSTTSAGRAASNAEDDLTIHHKRAIGSTKLRKRKSLRLKTRAQASGVSGKKTEPKGQHVHGYNTRNQPLTRAQKRAADREDKPKPSVKRQRSVNLPRKGSRPQSKNVRELRQKKRQERDDGVSSLWEALQATSPLDDMSLHLKKRLAVYMSLTQFYGYWGWQSREEIEEFVAGLLDLKPSSVHRWCHDFETDHYLEQDCRGKHSKVRSPLYDVEYQGFRERFRHYVKANSIGKDGSPNLTADALAEWVNSDLDLQDEDKYSNRTVLRWMHALGFSVHSVKNTLYVDGHERDDVVADRERLYKELQEVRPYLQTVDDCTLEEAENGAATHILISQDEKIHHSGDTQRRYWSDGTFTKLRQKSLGRTVMTSDFLSEIFGFIRYSNDDPVVPGERTGSVLDVSVDGYYNNERCLVDFAECSEAVKTLSEGKLGCVFLTDRSPIHCKYPEDGLNAKAMNVKPGGKQPRMRAGWYERDGRRVVQEMVFPVNHPRYAGLPKGLRQVVLERFGEAAVVGKKQDELVILLSNCDDFASQKTLLQEEAEARGDRVIYGVKFHPELAPIEAAYRSIAKAIRIGNSSKSSAGFVQRVERCQEPADLTLLLIRKHFRSSREYLKSYMEGMSLEEIKRLRKERRKHRGPAPMLPAPTGQSNVGKFNRRRVV